MSPWFGRVPLVLLGATAMPCTLVSFSTQAPDCVEATVPTALDDFTVADFDDYLIQDTCRQDGQPVPGDPLDCACHSDLVPGERVHASFSYATAAADFALTSIPRTAPHGQTAYVAFDSGNGVSGKGMFDIDDPHCKVPGSLCAHDGDVDIIDLVEATWDSSWYGLVSILGTAHIGTGGYLGFTTQAFGGQTADWPDGWLLGGYDGTFPTQPLELDVYADDQGTVVSHTSSAAFDKVTCSQGLGTIGGPCTSAGLNRWLLVDRMYMGGGKSFDQVLVSLHSTSVAGLDSCTHLELFLHSREYGLMSHQTWRKEGCDPGPNGLIGCSDSELAMVAEPLVLFDGGQSVRLERKACTRAIHNGPLYSFDPRSWPAPSQPVPYPDAPVVEEAGDGNVLLNPQLAWPDMTAAGWTAFDAILGEVESGVTDAARRNDAATLRCDGDCLGSSMYQDLDLSTRAPGLIGEEVDFGARVAQLSGVGSSGSVYLWQYRADRSANGETHVRFTTEGTWPDPSGTFVEGRATIDSDTRFVRMQVYIDDPAVSYALDDLFLIRAP